MMPRKHYARPCASCATTFVPSNSLNRFCSRACAAAGQVKKRPPCPVCHLRPVVAPNLTCGSSCGYRLRKLRTRSPRTCECGVEFMPYPSALNRGGGRFCSIACARRAAARRPAMIAVVCSECGTTFRRTQGAVGRVKRQFCSRECQQLGNQGEKSPVWRGGHDPNRGPAWRSLAETIRERDGFRCRRCGKTQEDAGQRLSVDHVLPWRSFEDKVAANDPRNLVSLCRSCHAKKARAERLWLQGDVLDMWRYQTAVAQPWTDS